MATKPQAARMAENEAIFRDANEQIGARARELEFEAPVPFLCECGDPACQEIARLSLDEYRDVRRDAVSFLVVPDHVEVATASGSVVETHDGYVVVQKTGVAGDVAERHSDADAD